MTGILRITQRWQEMQVAPVAPGRAESLPGAYRSCALGSQVFSFVCLVFETGSHVPQAGLYLCLRISSNP